ncbi:MAG: PEP-CTERM sorting domain-containing protein [Gammaproteobacteria bacterium]|nr:PEP-CTERM sorting domain-containing protein [Gammaproteobacteria bacterium]
MMFTKTLLASVVTLALSLTTTLALALSSLSFDLSSSTGNVGDPIVVDLVWDGTGGTTLMYLGDFDVDIVYDPSIVSFLGGIIDPDFGVDSFGCFVPFDCDINGSTPGTINLFEISFDTILDLIANQDGLGNRFSLATLSFEGLADGLTALTLNGINFGDENGTPMSPTLINGDITIGDPGTPTIPEPSTLLLLGTGLAGLAAWRIRQQRAR